MNKIETKIKELFRTKQLFCSKFGYSYKDFATKLRTVNNRIVWLNEFLQPLNLQIIIKEIDIMKEYTLDYEGSDHELWTKSKQEIIKRAEKLRDTHIFSELYIAIRESKYAKAKLVKYSEF